MQHATGLWICDPGITERRVLTSLKKHAPDLMAADPWMRLGRRAAPGVTAVTAWLDSEFELEFELLDAAALALAKSTRKRVYRLYHFTGSGDFLWVEAFDAKGRRWGMSTGDGKVVPEPENAHVLPELKALFGKRARKLEAASPYWRMWSELSRTPQEVIALSTTPPLEFGDGWKVTALNEDSPQPFDDDEGVETASTKRLATLMDREVTPDGTPIAERPEVKALIALGKKKGRLSFEELSVGLGELADMSRLVDDVLELLDAQGIPMVP